MTFINVKMPQSPELRDPHKQKALKIQVEDFPGSDVIGMANVLAKIFWLCCKEMMDNIALARIFTENRDKCSVVWSAPVLCSNL